MSAIAFSPGDAYLLAAGYDSSTALVALNDGGAIVSRKTNPVTVTAVAFDARGRRFAAGSEDGVVQVYGTADPATELLRLRNTGRITAPAFSPDGKRLAAAAERSSSPWENEKENHPLRVWLLDPPDLMRDARQRVAAFR